jgi:chromosome segregation ATPase
MKRDQDELNNKIDTLKKISLDKDITNMEIKTKVEAATGRINESQDEIQHLANKSCSILNQLKNSNLDSQKKSELLGDLSYSINRKTSLINKVNEEIKDISDTISKADILGFINDLLSQYKEFLATLDSHQLGCLTNIIGFSIII